MVTTDPCPYRTVHRPPEGPNEEAAICACGRETYLVRQANEPNPGLATIYCAWGKGNDEELIVYAENGDLIIDVVEGRDGEPAQIHLSPGQAREMARHVLAWTIDQP